MGKISAIIFSNWVHIVGFYISAYLSGIIFKIIGLENERSWSEVIIYDIFFILLSFFLYGILIVLAFYIVIVILDIILFTRNFKWFKQKFILEWLIVSTPFIYWAFKYEFWLWVSLSISFFITQMIRFKMNRNILDNSLTENTTA